MTAEGMRLNRSWCGRYAWPGRSVFWFGTVLLRADAPQHEVEAELGRGLATILPVGLEPPALVALVPGALFFQPEEERS